MGEVWPTAHITELCLQLTAGSRPVNGDEHRTLRSQSCERALLTTGTLPYLYLTFTFLNTCFVVAVRDTFCSYHVMDLCTKELGPSISSLHSRGVNLSNVRTLCVIAEERPRIQLTSSFSKLFSNLGLSVRSVSTSFGCRVNVGICLQVWHLTLC